MPRCSNGTRKNKKTGLCEPVKKNQSKPNSLSSKIECPSDKILNPKTNRCIQNTSSNRKRLNLIKENKICAPGNILNSKNNVCNIDKKTLKKYSKPKNNNNIKNVLSNLITINGHGTYNTKKIKVPDGFQVLIPHRNEMDQDYTTPDADKNKLYE
jgi:hypothetical protein